MRTTLMALTLLLAACTSTQQHAFDKGLWRDKADPDLQNVVDRYETTMIDTTVTLMVIPTRTWVDAERAAMVEQCQLQLADRLDSVVMVICPSRSIPCLGASPMVDGLLLSPPWSPDL